MDPIFIAHCECGRHTAQGQIRLSDTPTLNKQLLPEHIMVRICCCGQHTNLNTPVSLFATATTAPPNTRTVIRVIREEEPVPNRHRFRRHSPPPRRHRSTVFRRQPLPLQRSSRDASPQRRSSPPRKRSPPPAKTRSETGSPDLVRRRSASPDDEPEDDEEGQL